MRTIDAEGLKRLVASGAQLIEVLPPAEFEDEHLPGARNVPLKELDRAQAETLNRDAPVIVYCHDYQ